MTGLCCIQMQIWTVLELNSCKGILFLAQGKPQLSRWDSLDLCLLFSMQKSESSTATWIRAAQTVGGPNGQISHPPQATPPCLPTSQNGFA